jgi:hypothetical protein
MLRARGTSILAGLTILAPHDLGDLDAAGLVAASDPFIAGQFVPDEQHDQDHPDKANRHACDVGDVVEPVGASAWAAGDGRRATRVHCLQELIQARTNDGSPDVAKSAI